MNRIAMSAAASGLFRALIARSGAPRHRVLLMAISSTDWQSLTMAGERHLFELRVLGSHAQEIADRICIGIEDAEFAIPGQIVADIAVLGTPQADQDGSVTMTIEALTIAE